ncbi:MAG: hypothetical protein HY040_06510 [Planctomycetes bacterium]|nr:hypothetical protein [Planctomycetota bacterium]
MCFAAGTLVHSPSAVKPIQYWEILDEADTFGRNAPSELWHEINRASDQWKVLLLFLPIVSQDADSQDGIEIKLLRNVAWMEANCVGVGGLVNLDLPELGVHGTAQLLEIGSCPRLGKGAGRLVTGTFKRMRSVVYDLHLEGEPRSIGATEKHAFWSSERNGWVPLRDLQEGERLQGKNSIMPRVNKSTLRAGLEPVYNIEVEGDHCYRIGEQGILVHNASWYQETIDQASPGLPYAQYAWSNRRRLGNGISGSTNLGYLTDKCTQE